MVFQKKKIFISHSSQNAEIAEQLTSLLRNMGISSNQIFCSSVLGQGIDNGEKLNDTIHTSLENAKVIIYILSDSFIKSSYCMEELGVGWFRASNRKTKCYYLRVPDFEMHELHGFVNSKIDIFSIINEFADTILLIENIANVMSLKNQKASVFSSYAKTFISAIKKECEKAIEEKDKKKAQQEQYQKEIENYKEKLDKANGVIESYEQSIEINKAEAEKESLMIELDTIVRNYRLWGVANMVTKDIILYKKQVWFIMANRYEELLELLNLEPDDAAMEILLSQLYLVCENYEKAYHHFLNAINLAEYLTEADIEFFVESYPFSLEEITKIYEEKYNEMPEGLTRDFIKDSLSYMKASEEKKHLV